MGVDASSKGGAGVLRRALSLIINMAIALIALSAWAGMTFTVDKHGQFSAGGLENLKYFHESIPWIDEVSIGHALICDALYMGLQKTVQAYLKCLD